MAANTTYVNIQDRVLEQISKSDSVTRNRIKNSINMGYQDFVLREQWPFREKTGSLVLVAGTQEYDLSTNFTDLDEQNITSVSVQGDNARKLTYIPFNQLRVQHPDYDTEGTSVPQYYYIKANQIGFWPLPNDAYSVAIDYSITPTELSSDSDEPIIPVGYREALMRYALSMEHDFNSDPDLAVKEMNTYENFIAKARISLLAQPNDDGNFRIMGPQDFRNWSDIV